MSEVIRPSSIDPDAPRRALVPRVYAERAGTAFKVLAYRLRKAILGQDHDALVKAAYAMTSEERYAALEQFEQEDEIRKGYWDPERRNYSAAAPRPEQQRAAPAPKRPSAPPTIGPEGTGPRVRVEKGSIIHFTAAPGDGGGLIHAKVMRWGEKGITAIDADGTAWGVIWRDVKAGVHESARAEQEELVQKSETASWNEQVRVLTMSPEQRARHFERRGGF